MRECGAGPPRLPGGGGPDLTFPQPAFSVTSPQKTASSGTSRAANPRPSAVVHVDLDGARHIFQAHGWSYPEPDDPLFESGMRNLLDLFDQRQITATFFVIAEDLEVPAKRELILEARQRGHELASHTTTHRPLTALGPDERVRELVISKSLIESAAGKRVAGFRAPGFALDETTLTMIAEAGYAYDSSMFGGTRSPRGARGSGTPWPHRPLADHDLLELPLPGYAGLPVPFHVSYSLLIGWRYFRLGLRRFLSQQIAPFVFLLHLTDLADPLDTRVLRDRGWRSTLFTLSMMSAAQKRERLERMLDELSRRCELTATPALLGALPAHHGVPA